MTAPNPLVRRWRLPLAALTAATCAAAAGSALATSVDGPAGRVTVTHLTQVQLEVRLIRHAPGQTATLRDETVEGMAGDPIPLEQETMLQQQPARISLSFRAGSDQDEGTLPLTVVSRVQDGESGRTLARLERSLDMPDGRLRLIDLWSSESRRERLVLALSATWEEVPRVVPVRPDAHPVDLVVEVLRETGNGSHELLERHRLSTLIGSPVSYTFVHRPHEAAEARSAEKTAEEERGPPGRMEIEILPDSLADDEVGLSIALRHEGRDIYSKVSSLDLEVRHEVGPGLSVDLPLPDASRDAGLVFRVTPYF